MREAVGGLIGVGAAGLVARALNADLPDILLWCLIAFSVMFLLIPYFSVPAGPTPDPPPPASQPGQVTTADPGAPFENRAQSGRVLLAHGENVETEVERHNWSNRFHTWRHETKTLLADAGIAAYELTMSPVVADPPRNTFSDNHHKDLLNLTIAVANLTRLAMGQRGHGWGDEAT